jgi:hypothetical protein
MSSTQEDVIMRAVHVLAICAMATIGTAANAQEIDWKKVDEAIGRSAAVSGDVHRYGFPRTDLTVTLDGVTIRPTLALGGWAAFKPMHGTAMVMGDLVLLETEINPVMAKLIENGIEITAVHNHVLRGNPATFYMHIGGQGDPVKLATAIRTGLAASKTPLTPPAAPASDDRRTGPSRIGRSCISAGFDGWRSRLPKMSALPRRRRGREEQARSGAQWA